MTRDASTQKIGANIIVTGALAKVVGLIANRHEDCAVQIEWHEGQPEQDWIVTATDGVTDHVYLVDDESGHWMPLNADDLARLDRGEQVVQ